jgi:class 3 adenylate cyclase/tetratricopeptide (TPR) repeat protein
VSCVQSTEASQDPSADTEPDAARQPPLERLAGRVLQQDERKTATILFADIVGSTAMVSRSDPEVALDILRPALNLLSEAVKRYGGTVNRVTGDGLMALFGAPFSDEEHALGACCAALEMHTALTRSGLGVELRVGINSGEIVVHPLRVGNLETVDAAGEAVHLAARLQQAASAGSTWISDATFALARGRVETRIVGPLPFRGFDRPMGVHVLQAADASLTRLDVAGKRGLSPFVNRTRELHLLEAAFGRAAAGHGCAIALEGDAGVGKSRLIREFVAARSGVRVLEATCTRWRDDTGFHSMRVLTRRLLGLDATEDAAAIHARLQMAAAAPDAPPAEALDAIAALQGVSAPSTGTELTPAGRPYRPGMGPLTGWAALAPNARRRRIIEGCLAALLQAALDKPLLVVLDDVHWTDSGTYDVIERLLDALAGSRLLLLLGWRSGYRFALAGHPVLTHVALPPLLPAHARQLARTALGPRASGDANVAELADRAAGNPFFIEEAAAIPDSAQVPPTVTSILSARVDVLRPDEKQFIEALVTVGEPTTAELLSSVLDSCSDSGQAQLAATELERAGLVRIDGAGDSVRIASRHPLLQEVVYHGLTRARRRDLHARIAVAMERLAGDRAVDEAAVLARHARLGEVWEAALRHARAAGDRAYSHFANREAVRFYEDALEALAHLPETTNALSTAVDLRFALRDPLYRLGRIADLRTRLDEAETLAERLADKGRLGQLLIVQSHYACLGGDYKTTIAAAERAATLAQVENDPALKLRAAFERALGEFGQGALAASIAGMTEVAEHAEDPGLGGRFGLDGPLAVVALGYQMRALTDLGDFNEAERIATVCTARAMAIGRPFTSIFAQVAEGYVLLNRGAAVDAVARFADAVAMCNQAEADLMRPVALSFLGVAEVVVGRIASGLEHLEAAVAMAADMGFMFQQPLRLALLAQALSAAGQSVAASQRTAEAHAMAEAQGDRISLIAAARMMTRRAG